MLTITTINDARVRNSPLQVAKLTVDSSKDYLTPSPTGDKTYYILIGTPYGFQHRTDGGIKLYNSAQSARYHLKRYVHI